MPFAMIAVHAITTSVKVRSNFLSFHSSWPVKEVFFALSTRLLFRSAVKCRPCIEQTKFFFSVGVKLYRDGYAKDEYHQLMPVMSYRHSYFCFETPWIFVSVVVGWNLLEPKDRNVVVWLFCVCIQMSEVASISGETKTHTPHKHTNRNWDLAA